MKLTTTLALIKKHAPCGYGMETLLAHLGEDYPEDKEINLLTILDSNGIDHFFWAFRAVKEGEEVAKWEERTAAEAAYAALLRARAEARAASWSAERAIRVARSLAMAAARGAAEEIHQIEIIRSILGE